MKREYWDKLTDCYEDEVFEVIKHDRQEHVINAVKRHADQNATASDLGCGIGDFIPILSSHFGSVAAIDISPKNIARAQAEYSDLQNVSYKALDMAKPGVRLPKVEFALCVNAILIPSLADRNRIFDAVCRHICHGGHLALVVPSLESALLSNFRLIEWNLRSGISPSVAARAGFQTHGHEAAALRLHEGIVEAGGAATKHYLKEELIILLQNRGMEVQEFTKIEYDWKTEFESAPRWMKGPFPWDWLCIAKKIKR